MYAQRIKFFPAAGKQAELRWVLEERVQGFHDTGARASLALGIASGGQGNAFSINIFHNTLADFQDFRLNNRERQSNFQDRLSDLVASPTDVTLSEILARPDIAKLELKAPYFWHRATLHRKLGKGPELKALVEDRATKLNETGRPAMLSESIYGYETPVFELGTVFQDLASLEESRNNNRKDPDYIAMAAKLQDLVARPAQFSLLEILVPTPRP